MRDGCPNDLEMVHPVKQAYLIERKFLHRSCLESLFSSMNGSSLLVWLSIIGYVVATKRAMYGECVKTCGFELPLRVMFMDRHCIRDDDNCSYCKYYGCPPVECFSKGKKVVPEITPDGRCMACKGRCVYGGEVFKKGDKFMAVDDLNTCKCQNQGRVLCTMKRKKPSISGFCDI
ncbi:uncharacterized protein LOC132561697 [Ylistrum balloti]|uniref:uncharacterized protein LOC132561697 n=1 Tax=Ylistrum balloti TaxID=509963 RepID=UPI002905F1DA|nr:uncharacterized protein LOC132561697 [Ylistrum balloti]